MVVFFQTNITSRSKDKIINNSMSDKTENEKNSCTEKHDLNNNLSSPKINLKNKNKYYNINYSNYRISKNSTKNSEGGNNKLSKNNYLIIININVFHLYIKNFNF